MGLSAAPRPGEAVGWRMGGQGGRGAARQGPLVARGQGRGGRALATESQLPETERRRLDPPPHPAHTATHEHHAPPSAEEAPSPTHAHGSPHHPTQPNPTQAHPPAHLAAELGRHLTEQLLQRLAGLEQRGGRHGDDLEHSAHSRHSAHMLRGPRVGPLGPPSAVVGGYGSTQRAMSCMLCCLFSRPREPALAGPAEGTRGTERCCSQPGRQPARPPESSALGAPVQT